eukprot:5084150-Alexandrium_andersonii.AAC.1
MRSVDAAACVLRAAPPKAQEYYAKLGMEGSFDGCEEEEEVGGELDSATAESSEPQKGKGKFDKYAARWGIVWIASD